MNDERILNENELRNVSGGAAIAEEFIRRHDKKPTEGIHTVR